jgi:RNA polymerase sigma factor (sigma-70 family)
MPNRRSGAVPRQMRTLFHLGVVGDLTDGQLLERCVTRGDEAAELAFAALVERHGPLVMRVCQHVLIDPHDAHDAFQATFLVLIRQTRSLWVRHSLGPWLHRVAYRVACRVRKSNHRRREHERRAAGMRRATVSVDQDWTDVATAIHEEVDRLPECFRLAVVLCDLEGSTHEHAARDLGVPIGTLKSRLTKARALLRGRLTRRGLAVSTATLVALGTLNPAQAATMNSLVDSTVRAALALVSVEAPAVGAIGLRVVLLTEEVLRAMFLSKLRVAWFAMAATAALIVGAVGVSAQQDRDSPSFAKDNGPNQAKTIERIPGELPSTGTAPAHISGSRRMMIARLEEERQQAKTRLERLLQGNRSNNDPLIAHMRRTVDSLDDLLNRIDVVLVDAAEKYPTIFDFTSERAESAGELRRQYDPYDPLRAWDADEEARLQLRRAEAQFKAGFLTKSDWQAARKALEAARQAEADTKAGTQAKPAQPRAKGEGEPATKPGAEAKPGEAWGKGEADVPTKSGAEPKPRVFRYDNDRPATKPF